MAAQLARPGLLVTGDEYLDARTPAARDDERVGHVVFDRNTGMVRVAREAVMFPVLASRMAA